MNDGKSTEGKSTQEPRAPREIERDIEVARTRLDRSLAELDRRRHELTDIKLQMRKHPAVFFGAGAVVLLALGGVGYGVYRSRKRSHKREELPEKVKRFRIAIGRAVDQPERVARSERPAWQKILTAVGTAIAVNLAKKMVERTWNRTVEAGRV